MHYKNTQWIISTKLFFHTSCDLYISLSSRSIGMEPMDFLKNSSSIVEALMARRAGSIRSSLPNLEGCVGYAVEMYLLKASCA